VLTGKWIHSSLVDKDLLKNEMHEITRVWWVLSDMDRDITSIWLSADAIGSTCVAINSPFCS
jgi:hypothetical protein